MHPNRAFAWTDRAAMRTFAAERAFASIATIVDDRPATAWAPLALAEDGTFRFHLARGNPVTAQLDAKPVLATVLGDHFYVSPDWYGTPDQVPTWNYEIVEIEGIARRLSEAELIAQVDALSAQQESRLAPKPAWTSAKMSPARFDGLLKAIVGFAIEVAELRGLRKFGQNKAPSERAGVVNALEMLGDFSAAARMKDKE